MSFRVFALALLFFSRCTENSSISLEKRIEKGHKKLSFADSIAIEMEAFLVQKMGENVAPPGLAVAIVRDSQVVFCRGIGLKKRGESGAVDSATVFRLASLSKGFAGILTAKMAADDGWFLDEKVQKTIPEFRLRDPSAAQKMTIENLLSQTTGLPYHAFTQMIEEGKTTREITLQFFPKVKLFAPPGERFAYQNVSFSLVSEVLKAKTGLEYPELLQKNLFEKAGLADASATFESLAFSKNRAEPHTFFGPDSISKNYFNSAPAGGVSASARDMAAWLRLVLGHQKSVVSDSVLAEVFRPRVRTEGERSSSGLFNSEKNEAWYALGWRVLRFEDGRELIWHGGFVNNYSAAIAFSKKDGWGIAVLANGPTDLPSRAAEHFFQKLNEKGCWKKNH